MLRNFKVWMQMKWIFNRMKPHFFWGRNNKLIKRTFQGQHYFEKWTSELESAFVWFNSTRFVWWYLKPLVYQQRLTYWKPIFNVSLLKYVHVYHKPEIIFKIDWLHLIVNLNTSLLLAKIYYEYFLKIYRFNVLFIPY